MDNKIDLSDVTFIIPVRIESEDRKFNFSRVIEFLAKTFNTNVIITESGPDQLVPLLLEKINVKSLNLKYRYIHSNDHVFHRTLILNEMLILSRMPVTVNYDIDVFMDPQAYVNARNKIMNEGYDLVFPYKQGENTQKRVIFPNKEQYNGENLFDEKYHSPYGTYCGHCQFFRTESYIKGGMENENFYSYGPEDVERVERFMKLGYKVTWMDDIIYHIEHSRGINSAPSNPMFYHNEALLQQMRALTKEETEYYYKTVFYIKKYRP